MMIGRDAYANGTAPALRGGALMPVVHERSAPWGA